MNSKRLSELENFTIVNFDPNPDLVWLNSCEFDGQKIWVLGVDTHTKSETRKNDVYWIIPDQRPAIKYSESGFTINCVAKPVDPRDIYESTNGYSREMRFYLNQWYMVGFNYNKNKNGYQYHQWEGARYPAWKHEIKYRFMAWEVSLIFHVMVVSIKSIYNKLQHQFFVFSRCMSK